MTKDEALKMAIDYLEYQYEIGAWGQDLEGLIGCCKEALAQPAQEPVAHIKQGMDGYPKLIFNGKFEYDSIAAKQLDIPLFANPAKQPAQEPIKDHCVHLGIDICKNKGVCKYCSPPKIDLPRLNHYNADFTRCGIQHKGKMYLFVADTHPEPSWQGLSDNEVREIRNRYTGDAWIEGFWKFYHDVEAKLKEKNHG